MEKLYKIETHMHTSQGSACAVSTGEEMARAHKAAGYDAIIITDHFFGGNTTVPRDLPWERRIDLYCAGYDEARRVGEEIGLKVFFGLEWAWQGTEYLTYGIGREWLKAHPEMLAESIPLFRLEDTGMGQQMQEYATSQVLHWFRRFDDYQALKQQARWEPLADYQRDPRGRGAGVEGGRGAGTLGLPAALLEPDAQRLSGCHQFCRYG